MRDEKSASGDTSRPRPVLVNTRLDTRRLEGVLGGEHDDAVIFPACIGTVWRPSLFTLVNHVATQPWHADVRRENAL